MGKQRKNVSPIPMAKRGAHEHVVLTRREFIATLRNRLYTEPQILEELANPDSEFFILNPQTNKPYSAGTINRDLQILKRKAIENAEKEFGEYKAMQLAEIREARKLAWKKPTDLKMVAKFLELEMKLTGTDRSITLNQFNQQNNYLLNEDGEPKTVDDMTDKELMLIASKAIGDGDVIEAELVEEED